MRILNYIFIDDYFKIDFESDNDFKIIIGYKRNFFFLKTTKKSHLFVKATKSLSRVVVIKLQWFKFHKSNFTLEPQNLRQNDFPSKDLSYTNRADTQGIERRTGDLLNYNNNLKKIKLNTPSLRLKELSNSSNSINYIIESKYTTKIIKYKRPILRTK